METLAAVSSQRQAKKRPLPAESSNGQVQESPALAVKRSKRSRSRKSETKEENEVLLDWTAEELTQLVNNLSACLPPNDIVKFTTLVGKLDWEKVRFGQYTATQCKDKWLQISRKLRLFRTLTDLVTDAKEWLKHPWSSYNSSKKQKHPERPRKPLTPYFRYHLEKKEQFRKDNPDMSNPEIGKLLSQTYQQLPNEEKQKYQESFEKENEIYKQALEKFKMAYPEEFAPPKVIQQALTAEGPDKAHTASNISTADSLKKPEFSELPVEEDIEPSDDDLDESSSNEDE